MTFLDFFSGIGTIRIGMEQAGHECVGHVEWDKFAQQAYMAMHEIKEDEYCGWDITKVRADELPRADLWTFGAPCQDFSIAGNRQGLKGERSSLVHEIFRLIEETPEENRPTWLFYENVKGMLSSNGGWDFLRILLEMDRLGYDVEWQVLNSKDWGVPQNRERVLTIGHLRGKGTRKIFPQSIVCNETKIEVTHLLDLPGKEQTNRVYSVNGISPALTTMQGGRQEPKILWGNGIRKLTPKECWRLQGIPDEFFERAKASGISDSQLYKQAGNACTVNVIYEIAKKLGGEQ